MKVLASGELDERRLLNYQKLLREQERNGLSLAERRAGEREFARGVQRAMTNKQARRG